MARFSDKCALLEKLVFELSETEQQQCLMALQSAIESGKFLISAAPEAVRDLAGDILMSVLFKMGAGGNLEKLLTEGAGAAPRLAQRIYSALNGGPENA